MKTFWVLIFFLQITGVDAQWNVWKRLSKPEKKWVMLHPFVALKTYRTTQFVVQSMNQPILKSVLDSFKNGGKLDAFRHIYWMACVAKKIGARKALQLGIAHEKGNFISFEKGNLEEGFLPDEESSRMDSLNNCIGANIGGLWRMSKSPFNQNEIIKYINNGTAYMLKRNAKGEFLNCNNQPINNEPNTKKWKSGKCIVRTL